MTAYRRPIRGLSAWAVTPSQVLLAAQMPGFQAGLQVRIRMDPCSFQLRIRIQVLVLKNTNENTTVPYKKRFFSATFLDLFSLKEYYLLHFNIVQNYTYSKMILKVFRQNAVVF
jgi:hypothetical protein